MNKVFLYLSCFSAVIADMMLVTYAKTSKSPLWLFMVALVINFLGCLIWTYSMKKGIESSMAITTYALFTVAGCSILGVYVFKEQLSTLNLVGVILALIALILMNI